MKQVCEGCVWIQPSIMRSSASQKSTRAPSFIISHVSEEFFCSGMTSRDMKRALEMRDPQRIPQVSKFALVFGEASFKKVERRVGGRKMVRSGVPFSRYAEGLKVKLAGINSFPVTEATVDSTELKAEKEGSTEPDDEGR